MKHSGIGLASSKEEIDSCFPVMAELRPHLSRVDFSATIQRLMATANFSLACLDDGGIKAVAGFRVSEWLHAGKYLEIEDLVTVNGARSKGYGGRLFDWLVSEAARQSCRQVRLLSGVKRTDAHRFYLRKGMSIEAHYFSLNVPAAI
ncbi:MAG TPA: GNAT family N-acetyltransferase [Steroidobacteraceae bacterium]|nr:GNAT family N-acetyltransferase [Steroidobacteraceae bacterium]